MAQTLNACDSGSDVWPGGHWSPYAKTLAGQFEYWAVVFLAGIYRNALSALPPYYYGAYISLMLYLTHWAYSPFVDHPEYTTKSPIDWKAP